LVALDEDRQTEGQSPLRGNPRPAGFEEGHQLALVVGSTAGKDALSAIRAFPYLGFKGRTFPQVQRVGWLHIVMTVEQDAGRMGRQALGRMIGNYDRPSGRLFDTRRKAEIAQHALEPRCRPETLAVI